MRKRRSWTCKNCKALTFLCGNMEPGVYSCDMGFNISKKVIASNNTGEIVQILPDSILCTKKFKTIKEMMYYRQMQDKNFLRLQNEEFLKSERIYNAIKSMV